MDTTPATLREGGFGWISYTRRRALYVTSSPPSARRARKHRSGAPPSRTSHTPTSLSPHATNASGRVSEFYTEASAAVVAATYADDFVSAAMMGTVDPGSSVDFGALTDAQRVELLHGDFRERVKRLLQARALDGQRRHRGLHVARVREQRLGRGELLLEAAVPSLQLLRLARELDDLRVRLLQQLVAQRTAFVEIKQELTDDLATAQQQQAAIDDAMADEDLCVVCMDRERSCLYVPCNHLAVCGECDADIKAASQPCPMCNTEIDREGTLMGVVVA